MLLLMEKAKVWSNNNFISNRNVHKVRGHPSLQKGGCHEVHDIEDLVKVGQVVRGSSHIFILCMKYYNFGQQAFH